MLLRALPWAIWLALTVFSVATYGGLPDEIPRNLSAAGGITRSAPRTIAEWMMVPAIGLVVHVGLVWLGTLLPSRPDLFNFSEKERFLRIPPEYRGPVIARMRDALDGISAATMLVMFAAQLMLWRSALGEPSGAMVGGLIAITVLTTPLALILTLRVNTAVDEAERRWRAATPRER